MKTQKKISEKRTNHNKMKEFLMSIPVVEYEELKPIGFAINTSTIPKEKIEEFLNLNNK